MSEHHQIYQYARVAGTISAGIFTGLALSAPLYTVPAASSFSLSKSAQQKKYASNTKDLSPSDRLTIFKTIHHTMGAVGVPLASISAGFFAVAAYYIPIVGKYNARYVGKGAGELGSRYVSDSLLTRLTAPRALLIGSTVFLLSILPISSLITESSARSALALQPRLQADAAIASTGVSIGSAGGEASDAEKQLDKQLAKWTSGAQLAGLVGFLATLAGTLQLSGHSVTD